LRQAASIARALEGRVANRPKRGEGSAIKAALTLADTAAQEALLVPLFENFPGVSLEAEEDTPSVHRFPLGAEARVIIDPIDGTLRFYLDAIGPYAVMVGLAVEREYRAALVAVPREGYYLDAVRGGGAHFASGDAPPGPARLDPGARRVFVSHDLTSQALARLRRRGYAPEPASGGAISVAPLLPGVRAGLRVARARGSSVSARGRIGALISAEAGALVRSEAGELPSDIDAPVRALLVAADAEALEALEDALAAAR
jgi:hypothetical protein